MKHLRWLGLSLLCLGLGTGCLGYKVGPTDGSRAGTRSVRVNFFQNQTLEPRLAEAVNHALRKQLQQDGTWKLSTHGDSDIVVNGVITRYKRDPLTFRPGDILTVRDYDIFLTAKITALERSTGKVLFDKEVTGRTIIRVGTDMASVERQALPLLAEDFARNATGALVDGAW